MPRLIDLRRTDADTLSHQALLAGLQAASPWVPPRYFYDELGCTLFSAITQLPEYYPARLEREIFDAHAGAIAEVLPRQATLVDLGAGDGRKAQALLPRLQPAQYFAVDIAGEFTQRALQPAELQFPSVDMCVLACDLDDGLQWLPRLMRKRPILFYPGSSIGNFSPGQARQFLQQLCQLCQCSPDGQGDLLIGVDLLKDRGRLLAAYDDALGVTAAFNRNLLRHVNRLIDADFNVDRFHHRAAFNEDSACIEMWLVPDRIQQVRWHGGGRVFAEGEGLLSERSHKYTVEGFGALLAAAGFETRRHWLDASAGYLISHACSR